MTTEKHAMDRSRMATFIWFSMLLSSPLIFAVVYFMLNGEHFVDLAPRYELWFLLAGIVSAIASLPAMGHFRRATARRPATADDSAYWQRVNAAMFAGHAAADIPFFVGMAAFLAGGYTRTAILLLVLSLALNSRFKPPRH